MMTRGSQSLHVSGAKVVGDIQMDVNATNAAQHLKQELINAQADNKKLTEQLNCLISLIKRSWSGDKHATVHLSNIVGLDPPNYPSSRDGTQARPNSKMYTKTRSEQNWERLTVKLLDREYQAVQEEIREYQQRYIENRQAYMDAILQDHHSSMSRIPLHRNSETSKDILDVDAKFIRHNQSLQRMGVGSKRLLRSQSAGSRRRQTAQDAVEKAEMSLRDLVGEGPSSSHFVSSQPLSEPRIVIPSSNGGIRRPQTAAVPYRAPNTYNDPNRYHQRDLYTLDESDVVKKSRPVSASSLREGDIARARPRSGFVGKGERTIEKPVFVTQRNERPLKYESTHPVYTRPKSSKQRRNSTGGVAKTKRVARPTPQTDVISATNAGSAMPEAPNVTVQPENHSEFEVNGVGPHINQQADRYYDNQGDGYHDSYADADSFVASKPPMSIRVKSASLRRPAYIDEFADEERAMRNMENDFKKTALSLQKRLGIQDGGMVNFE